MQTRHLTADDYTTSAWSGGTTTQLYIFPENGDYPSRRFDFRISSAAVEQEESTFTSLPGVWRYITPLTGSFELIHEGHHTVSLKPLEIDSFSGSWNTRCRGKAVDFNLMLRGGCDGKLTLFTPPGEMMLLPRDELAVDCFYFLRDGYFVIDGRREDAKSGDLLVLMLEPCDMAVQLVLPPHPFLHVQIEY